MLYPEKLIDIKGVYGIIDARKTPDFSFEGESHPFWELVYVKEGCVGVAADERIYSLSAGDVIFHKPMEFHRIWSAENSSPNLNIITFEAGGKRIKELEDLTSRLDESGIILLERCVELGKKHLSITAGAWYRRFQTKEFARNTATILKFSFFPSFQEALLKNCPWKPPMTQSSFQI